MISFKSDHRLFSMKHKLMSQEASLQLFSMILLLFSMAAAACLYFGCHRLSEKMDSAAQMLWILLGAGLSISFILFAWMMSARQGWVEIEKRSRIDALTGLMNYPAFEAMLEEETRRAGRYRYPLTLCLFDLDDFNSRNQEFGKKQGDEDLRRFGAFVRGSIRFADCVARYQNDEFLVLLPHTDIVRAEKFMARLLAQTESKTDCFFSAGVTSFQTGETKDQFLARAQTALAEAKREGRRKIRYLIGDSRAVLSF